MSLGIVGLALGAIGTGIQVYSGIQASKTQETYARLNAQSQLAQSQMASRLATAQAGFESQKSLNEQNSAIQNAAALASEAGNREKADRLNAERLRQDQLRFRSLMLAGQGKTGTVADTGSQLDILLNAAELQALETAENHYQGEIERRKIARERENVLAGGRYAGIQSDIDIMEGESRASGYRAQGVQAQIQGLAGIGAARGAMWQSIGSGVGDLSGLAWRGYQLRQSGALG
jgi:hypothetical protein